MNVKNRYCRRSRISEKEFRQLLRCIAMDFTARDTAKLTDFSVRSVNSIYLKLRRRIAPDTVIHSDGWCGYDGLVDIGFDKHFRMNQGANEFARGEHHNNRIELFWSYAKRRLQQFNGISALLLALERNRIPI